MAAGTVVVEEVEAAEDFLVVADQGAGVAEADPVVERRDLDGRNFKFRGN